MRSSHCEVGDRADRARLSLRFMKEKRFFFFLKKARWCTTGSEIDPSPRFEPSPVVSSSVGITSPYCVTHTSHISPLSTLHFSSVWTEHNRSRRPTDRASEAPSDAPHPAPPTGAEITSQHQPIRGREQQHSLSHICRGCSPSEVAKEDIPDRWGSYVYPGTTCTRFSIRD